MPPSAAVLYRFCCFTGSMCRTRRELSIRLSVRNSIIGAAFLLLMTSYLFRAPQFRTSRPRVRPLLFLAGPHHVLRQNFQLALPFRFPEPFFHDPVFTRVVRQNHAPPSWI